MAVYMVAAKCLLGRGTLILLLHPSNLVCFLQLLQIQLIWLTLLLIKHFTIYLVQIKLVQFNLDQCSLLLLVVLEDEWKRKKMNEGEGLMCFSEITQGYKDNFSS